MNISAKYDLERIKKLVVSPQLMDATDADTYLCKMSAQDMQAVFDYCVKLYEMTGDRNYKFAMDRIRKSASSKRANMENSTDTPISSYLQDILNGNKMYPIARRPGHPDWEN